MPDTVASLRGFRSRAAVPLCGARVGRLPAPAAQSAATGRHARDSAAAAAPATPPGSAAVEPSMMDWNAAPTNGSPGVHVPPLSGHELLKNNTFEGGKYIPWTTSFTTPGTGTAAVKDGQFCITVTNKGVNPWDAQARHREMVIRKGHTYTLSYMAHATKPVQVKAKVGMSGPPYKEYWTDTVDLTTHPQTFVGAFTMEADDDATAELAFHFGGRDGRRHRRAVHRLLRRHPPGRPAVQEERKGLGRGGADPERAGQPDRLLAGAAQAGDGEDHPDGAAEMGAAPQGRRPGRLAARPSRSARTRRRATTCRSSISRR